MDSLKPIEKEVKIEIAKKAADLSNIIHRELGEVELWYQANRIWRAIDELKEVK